VLRRVVRHALPNVGRFLDLGCGDGILGRTVLGDYPQAAGVFLDFSEYMIDAARQKAGNRKATFVVQSFAETSWTQSIEGQGPFDLIVSGLAIHHLVDQRKRELYQELFDLLAPGGLFLNLEHVALGSEWAREAYDELFVDSLWTQHRRRGGEKSREVLAEDWKHRLGKAKDIPAAVELQCRWLQEVGFIDVDCFLKVFGLALFGGRKPT
jgi:SAM-dependent methyltransferase